MCADPIVPQDTERYEFMSSREEALAALRREIEALRDREFQGRLAAEEREAEWSRTKYLMQRCVQGRAGIGRLVEQCVMMCALARAHTPHLQRTHKRDCCAAAGAGSFEV